MTRRVRKNLAKLLIGVVVCMPVMHNLLPHMHSHVHAASERSLLDTDTPLSVHAFASIHEYEMVKEFRDTHPVSSHPQDTDDETPVWTSLHVALSHDVKKVFVFLLALIAFWFGVRRLIPVNTIRVRIFFYITSCITLLGFYGSDPGRARFLSTGISLSRRFA